jgi:hypothetical protein
MGVLEQPVGGNGNTGAEQTPASLPDAKKQQGRQSLSSIYSGVYRVEVLDGILRLSFRLLNRSDGTKDFDDRRDRHFLKDTVRIFEVGSEVVRLDGEKAGEIHAGREIELGEDLDVVAHIAICAASARFGDGR